MHLKCKHMQFDLLMAALSRPSYCELTGHGQSDCSGGSPPVYKGSIRSKAAKLTVAGCKHSCLACKRCNFVSFSRQRRECSWFQFCDLGNLVPILNLTPTVCASSDQPLNWLSRCRPPRHLTLRSALFQTALRLSACLQFGKEQPLLIAATPFRNE